MAELYIVGQAPARTGDGRPFTGNSGKRLLSLFGWPSYDYMAVRVNLRNLLQEKAESLPSGRGDRFDMTAGRQEAARLLGHWFIFYPETHVVACGTKVYRCFTEIGWHEPFRGVSMHHRRYDTTVKVWYLPHPSGANDFWNNPRNVAAAKRFLRERLRNAASSPI